ncbi:MAG: TraM recognition domain-containing protein [Dokdonella sp.]
MLTHVTPFVGFFILAWHLSIRSHRHLPLRLPRSAGITDINHPLPGRKKFNKASGIVHIGNAVEAGNQELWLAKNDVLTHDLVLGVTGAGKTVMLVGSSANYIAMGGGLIYVDAKAAPSLPWDIYSLLFRVGMEDDFLIINYMTGNRSIGKAGGTRMTNTANPFASGSADSLVEIMSSLITAPEGDNAVFGERALSMITAGLYGLVDLRDGGHIDLGVEVFRDYLPLNKIEELAFDPRLRSDTAKAALLAYLRSLPNWKAPEERVVAKTDPRTKQVTMEKVPIHDEANRQHGFAQMYFTRALSSLTDTYGHIYRGSLGEVDFVDVVRRRRVLVVMLPALEKSLAGLANLGKINLSALKDAISTGLGSSVEGTRRDVLDTLPTASPIPSKLTMDEYGYMAVEGMSVVAAQARGLGWSVTYAGQDWAGIKRGSDIEASQIWANTNLKVFGKLQDQESYGKLAEAVGEAQITQTAGFNLNTGGMLGYADNLAASVERKARTDTTDLQAQIEGEAHIIYNGRLIRARFFYANPAPIRELQVNRFLRVGEKKAVAAAKVSAGGEAKDHTLKPQGGPASTGTLEASTAESMRQPRVATPSPPSPPSAAPEGAPLPDPASAVVNTAVSRTLLPPDLVPATPAEVAPALVPASIHRSVRDIMAAMDAPADDEDGDLIDASLPEPLPDEYTHDDVSSNVATLLNAIDSPEATAAAAEELERTLEPDREGLASFVPMFDDLPEGALLSEVLEDGTSDRRLLEEAVEAAINDYPSAVLTRQLGELTPDQVAADLRELLNMLLNGDGIDDASTDDHSEPGL